jgi:hypothetical protein
MVGDVGEQWGQQVARRVDRTLGRVYAADPLLYAELLKVRRRLIPRLAGMMDGHPRGRQTSQTADVRND